MSDLDEGVAGTHLDSELEYAKQLVLFENKIIFVLFDGYGLYLPTLGESTKRYLQIRAHRSINPVFFIRNFDSREIQQIYSKLRSESKLDARAYLGPIFEHFAGLKKRPLVFDVGGHVGIFSVLAGVLARSRGTTVRIVCFEPGPTQGIISANLEINQLTPAAEMVPAAVSDIIGPVLYSFIPTRTLGGRMGTSKERALSKIVRSTTLESFARDIAVNELGVVKIDVEGFEPEVISGMGDAREKFPVILMEFRSWQSNKEVGGVPLVEFLLDNYHILDTAEALYPRWCRRVAKDGFAALGERLDGQESKKTVLLLVDRNLPGATKLVETLAELQF